MLACRSHRTAPPAASTPAWLLERAAEEAALATQSPAPHDFRFTDRREASGITFQNRIVDDAGKAYKKVHYDHGSGLCAADVDGDGRPDLYFATQLGTNELWRNLGGGRFENITDQAGLRMDDAIAVGCAFADIDNDGDPDLFVTTVRHGNRLFENVGGGRFRDITATAGVGHVGHSSGAGSFDFDGEGGLDLFVTDMHSDMWANVPRGDWKAEASKADTAPAPADFFPQGKGSFIFGNALFANRGGGRFAEISDNVGVETYWPWGPSVDDLNADGWDDIFVAAGMNFPHRYGVNSVLLNEAGRHFLPAEFVVGVEPRAHGASEQVWFTLDCGGADRGQFFCTACRERGGTAAGCRWGAGGRLTMIGSLGTRAALALDLDGDGDLDIVTNEFNGPPQVLVSDLAQRHQVNFLKVRLRGTRSNREGLGSQVTVVLPDGRRVLKLCDGKSGYLSRATWPSTSASELPTTPPRSRCGGPRGGGRAWPAPSRPV